MRSGYIIETLTSADNQKVFKIGGKVIDIDEGAIYRENFRINPFRKVIDNLFALRQKYKEEYNDVMQLLLKLRKNILNGDHIRKDMEENFACKSEYWMISENDERVKDYLKLSHGK